MAFEGCIAKVTEFMKDKLDEKQIKAVVKSLENSLEREKKNVIAGRASADSLQSFLMEEGKRIVEAIEMEAAVAKRAQLINTRVQVARRGDMLASIEREEGSIFKGLQAKIVGTARSRNSAAAQQHAASNSAVGAMMKDLRDAGLESVTNNSAMDRLIAREMFQITTEGGKPGITGSKEAKAAAEVFTKHLEVARRQQNKAGAAIGKLDGYIVAQSHDRTKVRLGTFDKWAETILPLLDKERTFGNNDPTEYLQEAYKTIVTGQSEKLVGAATDNTRGFKGYSNLAKKVSHSRSLHFLDADAWMNYNDAYGVRELRENVVGGIIRGQSNAALMRNFGTNPRAAFEADLEWIKSRYRNEPEKLAEFQTKHEGRLKNYFDEVDGTARVSANVTLAQVGSTIRGLNNVTMLGGVVISSISDIPIMASEIRFQRGGAGGLFEGYKGAFENLMKGRRKAEQREIADLIGVGFEGMVGDMVSRFTANDTMVGTMSKMQQMFFKLNLLNWWTDSHKTGVALTMSRHLAMDSKKAWGGVPAETRKVLSMYDIGEAEWGIIQKSATIMDNGKEYITPDAIRNVPDEAFAEFTGELVPSKNKIARAKQEIEDKLSTYFTDRVDYAVLTPGAKEQADLRLGTKRGTAIGEVNRFIMQFKSFPVSMITKIYGREMYAGGKADIAGIVHLAVATSAFGYLAMTAKELLRGKKPRQAETPKEAGKIMAAAMMQGGGAGILGDFIFGEANRMGNKSIIASAAGPTASRLEQGINLGRAAVGELVMGEDKDLASKTFREVLSYTPGNNLFYLRNALNYLFIYDIQETLNPGYLRRMERRIRKENNQEFIYPPSRHVR